jgi:hypothetical protein
LELGEWWIEGENIDTSDLPPQNRSKLNGEDFGTLSVVPPNLGDLDEQEVSYT